MAKSFSVGIGAMIEGQERASATFEKLRKKPGYTNAEINYMIGIAENTREVLLWMKEYEAAIAKAAKGNVPWKIIK